jgi:hypothetical protein
MSSPEGKSLLGRLIPKRKSSSPRKHSSSPLNGVDLLFLAESDKILHQLLQSISNIFEKNPTYIDDRTQESKKCSHLILCRKLNNTNSYMTSSDSNDYNPFNQNLIAWICVPDDQNNKYFEKRPLYIGQDNHIHLHSDGKGQSLYPTDYKTLMETGSVIQKILHSDGVLDQDANFYYSLRLVIKSLHASSF